MVFGPTTQLLNPEMENLLSSRFTFAWRLIDETVLTSTVASVTFSSLPQNYRSLVSVVLGRTNHNAEVDDINVRCNGDSGNNYDRIYMQHILGGFTSGEGSALNIGYCGWCEGANSRSDCFAPSITWWPDYSIAREHYFISMPSMVVGNLSADADIGMTIRATHWRPSVLTAITSITFYADLGSFVSGSKFTIYGVL